MLKRGPDSVPPLPRYLSSLRSSTPEAVPVPGARPVADTLTAAGRPASAEAAAPGDALRREADRLRRRVRQQDESLARLAEALRALRDGARALRAENRELRLELERAKRLAASARPETRASL